MVVVISFFRHIFSTRPFTTNRDKRTRPVVLRPPVWSPPATCPPTLRFAAAAGRPVVFLPDDHTASTWRARNTSTVPGRVVSAPHLARNTAATAPRHDRRVVDVSQKRGSAWCLLLRRRRRRRRWTRAKRHRLRTRRCVPCSLPRSLAGYLATSLSHFPAPRARIARPSKYNLCFRGDAHVVCDCDVDAGADVLRGRVWQLPSSEGEGPETGVRSRPLGRIPTGPRARGWDSKPPLKV